MYDIALKSFMESSGEIFIREILKADVTAFEGLLELPQETVSVRTADFPVKVTDSQGRVTIHLIEFQTKWEPEKVFTLCEYMLRYRRKFPEYKTEPTMVLLKKTAKAKPVYSDDRFSFKFNLVKLWEFRASEYLDKGILLPMIPLMDGGTDLVLEAEQKIYESASEHRSDDLAILTILTGLKNRSLADILLKRRRDMLEESPVYAMIENIGFEKGIEKGLVQGMEQGIEKGIQSGSYQKSVKTARALLRKGKLSIEEIAEVTELTVSEVQNLV